MRRLARSCFTFAAAAALVAACIPDPKGEFEDYRERTAHLGPGASAADASIDTKPPDTATEGLYVGICVTALAAKDPNQALRFYTESKYTPDGTGGGKLALTVTPMRGWDRATGDYVTPSNVSRAETRGSPITAEVQVAPGVGRFTLNLGTMNLVGEANSISGRDAVIADATLDGRFGDPEFCSTLGGQLKVPYEYTFNPAENTCLFIKVTEGDPMPVRKSEQFVCPL